MKYLLKQNILGSTPEIYVTEQEYLDAKRCHEQNFQAFEIELAFDFMLKNYVEIEKYIAEHLVLDMTGQTRSVESFREQQWGFMRVFSNWLSSISFWHDLTRNRLIKVCGRGKELDNFKAASTGIKEDEFSSALILHLRNYSQHGGFPISGSLTGGSWNDDFSELTFSAEYTLSYDNIRDYFESDGKGSKTRKKFGNRIVEYSDGEPIDLKPIIRQSLKHFGKFMDNIRSSMSTHTTMNETFVLGMIKKFSDDYPDASLIGLSVIPVNDQKVVQDRDDIVPVRDEFINRAKDLRKKNSGKRLSTIEKRIISSV